MKSNKKNKIVHNKTVQPQQNQSKSNVFKYIPILVFLFGFLLYSNTIKHDYVLDDYSVIKEHLIVKKGLDGIPEIFKTTYRFGYWGHPDDLYRPLTLAVFAIQWHFWPDNPTPAHFFNVLFYALSGLLLYLLLRKLLKSYSPWLSIVSTLLFIAHPIHTEVVANIKSFDEIFSFIFLLISVWFVVLYSEKSKIFHLVFALVSYFLAFLSKESAIMFLAVFPLVLYFFTSTKKVQIVKISLFMLIPAVIFLIIRKNIVGAISGDENVSIVDNLLSAASGLGEHTATALKILGIYFMKLVFPHPLVADYSFNQIPIVGWESLWSWLALFMYGGLFVLAVMLFKRKHILSFAILFFFITISLYSNLVFQIGSSFGERFLFICSLGFVIAVAYGLLFLTSKHSLKEVSAPKPLFWTVFILILLFYSGKTLSRNADWKTNYDLYSVDYKNSPNSAHMRYYYALSLMKDKALNEKAVVTVPAYLDSAIYHFMVAAAIYPEYADAYDQLGLAWFRKGDYKKSLQFYETTLKYNPGKPITYSNMGIIYFTDKRYDKALEVYQMAVKLNPYFADAWLNLGSTYGTLGRNPESVAAFKKCIEISPDNAMAHYYLAITYQNMGDSYNASNHFSIAAQLDPKFGKK